MAWSRNVLMVIVGVIIRWTSLFVKKSQTCIIWIFKLNPPLQTRLNFLALHWLQAGSTSPPSYAIFVSRLSPWTVKTLKSPEIILGLLYAASNTKPPISSFCVIIAYEEAYQRQLWTVLILPLVPGNSAVSWMVCFPHYHHVGIRPLNDLQKQVICPSPQNG